MKLQIGDDGRTIYTVQLVYANCQDLCCETSYWLDQKFSKQMGTIKILKFLQSVCFVMPMHNQTKLECMYNKNIFKMHLKKVPRFKKKFVGPSRPTR